MTRPTTPEPGPRRPAARLLPWAALAWCGLIFATSSTVILPRDFLRWVGTHALTGAHSYRAFVAFWGVAWFAVVKGWHATEFAILCALFKGALDRLAPASSGRNLALAVAACLLFAASDEWHQTFVPGRGGTARDVAIDGLGVAVAAILIRRRDRTRDAVAPTDLGVGL